MTIGVQNWNSWRQLGWVQNLLQQRKLNLGMLDANLMISYQCFYFQILLHFGLNFGYIVYCFNNILFVLVWSGLWLFCFHWTYPTDWPENQWASDGAAKKWCQDGSRKICHWTTKTGCNELWEAKTFHFKVPWEESGLTITKIKNKKNYLCYFILILNFVMI